MKASFSSQELERRLNYKFVNHNLIVEAFTHRSYRNENNLAYDYERLEFLGDSVLNLMISHWLFNKYSKDREGRLSKYRSFLVSRKSLAKIAATKLSLDSYLLRSKGEMREEPSSAQLADVLEALMGAVYMDCKGNLEVMQKVFLPYFKINTKDFEEDFDPKSKLQEIFQAENLSPPRYSLAACQRVNGKEFFLMQAHVEGVLIGRASALTKNLATRQIALKYIKDLQASSMHLIDYFSLQVGESEEGQTNV